MKRSLRNKVCPVIIIDSDSENENKRNNLDESYHPEDNSDSDGGAGKKKPQQKSTAIIHQRKAEQTKKGKIFHDTDEASTSAKIRKIETHSESQNKNNDLDDSYHLIEISDSDGGLVEKKPQEKATGITHQREAEQKKRGEIFHDTDEASTSDKIRKIETHSESENKSNDLDDSYHLIESSDSDGGVVKEKAQEKATGITHQRKAEQKKRGKILHDTDEASTSDKIRKIETHSESENKSNDLDDSYHLIESSDSDGGVVKEKPQEKATGITHQRKAEQKKRGKILDDTDEASTSDKIRKIETHSESENKSNDLDDSYHLIESSDGDGGVVKEKPQKKATGIARQGKAQQRKRGKILDDTDEASTSAKIRKIEKDSKDSDIILEPKKTARTTKAKQSTGLKKVSRKKLGKDEPDGGCGSKDASICGADDNIKNKINLKLNEKGPVNLDAKEWTLEEYISEEHDIDVDLARKVLQLFNEDNTIPFIARYRKSVTNGMEADKLRVIKLSLDRANEVKNRANFILKTADNLGCWTPELFAAVKSSKSLAVLEGIYELYKQPPKHSKIQIARNLGLQSVADRILSGLPIENLETYVNPNGPCISDKKKLCETIKVLLIDGISKNTRLLEKVDEFQKHVLIKTTRIERRKSDDKFNNSEDYKYKNYWNFGLSASKIKPYQILAINRAKKKNCIKIECSWPSFCKAKFEQYCFLEYGRAMQKSADHRTLLTEAIYDFCKGNLASYIDRRMQRILSAEGEKAGIENFSKNLKELLLTPPVRGKVVLGIDPGYKHGCKLAVVSEQGAVLDVAVIYPHTQSKSNVNKAKNDFAALVKKYQCTAIALGNGCACRETEKFITDLIQMKAFDNLEVSYSIINEAGASVYSVSEEAKAEFPNMEPQYISAISIARRLQDLLAELVKVEPESLGVGMYQKDIPEKRLLVAMNEVISEVVSFVGVDVNTASHCLLRKVAGFGPAKATKVINYRTAHGTIKNREEIRKVQGIGPKTFQQCAGFLRVIPETAVPGSSKFPKELNLLDQTWIHPESYKVAEKFLNHCGCRMRDYGSSEFIEKVNARCAEGYDVLAKKCNTDEETIKVIAKGLSMKKDEDTRTESSTPVFRKGLTSVNDLDVGASLTGVVRNVTQFGTFVDIGVGCDGLIPRKYLNNQELSVNQRIKVKVIGLEIKDLEKGISKTRISLQLEEVL